jgi:hypothetical protein
MKQFFLTLLGLICLYPLTAQANPLFDKSLSKIEYDFMSMADKMRVKRNLSYEKAALEYKKYEGNPYWYEGVRMAKIIQNNDVLIVNVSLQMDQNIGEIIAQAPGENSLILETRVYKAILVDNGDTKDYFKKAHPDNPTKFYQVLFENDEVCFFKDIEVKLFKTNSSDMVMGATQPEFLRKNTYYLSVNRMVKKIQLKKKKFYQNFSKREEKLMASFAKKQKIKLKNENDFVTLLKELYK